MRVLPRYTGFFSDVKQNAFAQDIVRAFTSLLDHSTYTVDVVWSPPVPMSVPLFGGVPRAVSPDIVRVARATLSADTTTPVHFGATAWSWLGNNSINLTDVDGLVVGTKYRLVLEVIG